MIIEIKSSCFWDMFVKKNIDWKGSSKRQRSGVMEMFYILFCLTVSLTYTIVKFY